MKTEDKIIEIRDLSKFIDSDITEQGKDIPLIIYGGEKIGIAGMTGQSNLTLTKLLLGIDIADEGDIMVEGDDVSGFAYDQMMEHRRRVGVIFEDAQLVSNLKVIENVQLPLLYHTKRPDYDIMEQSISYLESVDYRDDLWKQPGSLSLYEKKIVNLARIMAMDPEIIIYDRLYKGLSTHQTIQIAGYTNKFHYNAPNRVSIFTASSEEDIKEFNMDRIIVIKQVDI